MPSKQAPLFESLPGAGPRTNKSTDGASADDAGGGLATAAGVDGG